MSIERTSEGSGAEFLNGQLSSVLEPPRDDERAWHLSGEDEADDDSSSTSSTSVTGDSRGVDAR